MSAPQPIVELDEVSSGYGRELVLERISLSLADGDFLVVIGPNGGGKTTLLKVILGLLPVWSGRIHRHTRRRRGAIGYVPQFATFERDFPVRVRDVVRSGRLALRPAPRRFRRDDELQVEAAMDSLGLTGVADAPVRDLSGGQLQRTLIARALAGEPELLLLDEPLASIDVEYRGRLVPLLEQLHRDIPILLVTHDVAPFAGVATRFACVNRRLFDHGGDRLSAEDLEEAYGCAVELVAHGVPHRVLAHHHEDSR